MEGGEQRKTTTTTATHQAIGRSSIKMLRSLLLPILAVLVMANITTAFMYHHQSRPMLAQRRAADDSRPIARQAMWPASSQQTPVVVGRFRAPAPERIVKQRLPKSSEFGSQTMSASYRVQDDHESPKMVHGITGASVAQKKQQSVERTVSAKMQVSDEGLNYPPSKLSADIYGNVAEIVTAPPEAVENDFLLPQNTRIYGARNNARST